MMKLRYKSAENGSFITMTRLSWKSGLYALLSLFFIAGLAQCSKKKSKSELALFTVLPERPIVITGDSVDSRGNAIKGPWFSFRLNMENKSGESITIVALVITVYGESESGTQTSSEVTFAPSDFDFSVSDTLKCTFSDFGTWAPDDRKPIQVISPISSSCQGIPVFYIGSNPSGVSGRNFRYRVVVKPQGWFGTFNDPKDRFLRQFTFYTQ